MVAWRVFSMEGKLDVYPLLPQEVPVAVAVLTGLLASLGWLAAHRSARGKREAQRSPAITDPHNDVGKPRTDGVAVPERAGERSACFGQEAGPPALPEVRVLGAS